MKRAMMAGLVLVLAAACTTINNFHSSEGGVGGETGEVAAGQGGGAGPSGVGAAGLGAGGEAGTGGAGGGEDEAGTGGAGGGAPWCEVESCAARCRPHSTDTDPSWPPPSTKGSTAILELYPVCNATEAYDLIDTLDFTFGVIWKEKSGTRRLCGDEARIHQCDPDHLYDCDAGVDDLDLYKHGGVCEPGTPCQIVRRWKINNNSGWFGHVIDGTCE